VPALRRELGLSAKAAREWVEETLFSVEGGAAATRSLIRRGATAVVCSSDIMALGAIQAARAAGLAVPKDFSVVGYDDSTLVAFLDPPLTTIRQPVQAMGAAAVSHLVDAIDGQPVPANDYLFQPELVLRRSTAAAPRD
jgi:LacI family transcriptional regulator, repressor for deo operon, udp, cdd, tsx, nupC, and nupG